MTVAHGEKFPDQQNICQKIHITCGRNPYKISGNIFFAPKNVYLLPDKKAAIFGTFFVSRITDQSTPDKHRR